MKLGKLDVDAKFHQMDGMIKTCLMMDQIIMITRGQSIIILHKDW